MSSQFLSAGSLVSWLCTFALAAGCGGNSFSETEDGGDAGDGGSVSGKGGAAGRGAGSAGDAGSGTAGSAQGGVSGSGGTGTSGTGSGGTGSGGTGTAGVSGRGGSAGTGAGGGSCEDPDQSNNELRSGARTRSTTTGDNGSFTDQCDELGNLVEYSCASSCGAPQQDSGSGAADRAAPAPGVGGASGVPCLASPNGQVQATAIDCGGQCLQGACFKLCPDFNDVFSVITIDVERVVLESEDGVPLDCYVESEGSGPDCAGTNLLGSKLTVTSIGACDSNQATFGVSPLSNATSVPCTYTCNPQIASSG